jgi:hypothetical protein
MAIAAVAAHAGEALLRDLSDARIEIFQYGFNAHPRVVGSARLDIVPHGNPGTRSLQRGVALLKVRKELWKLLLHLTGLSGNFRRRDGRPVMTHDVPPFSRTRHDHQIDVARPQPSQPRVSMYINEEQSNGAVLAIS